MMQPAVKRLGIPAYNWWNEGLHGVARSGQATVFPQAIALAASFDTELLHDVAEVIATEGRAKYNENVKQNDRDIYKGLTFWSPNVNIFRDPRWGRGHETYGEDPYLTGKLGNGFCKRSSGRWQNTGRPLPVRSILPFIPVRRLCVMSLMQSQRKKISMKRIFRLLKCW